MTLRHDESNDGAALPDALRWQLRALRQDTLPAQDLWPRIAPRLDARATERMSPRTPWLALAASLLLVAGVIGLWRGLPQGGQEPTPTLAEAGRLSDHYRQALASLPADARRADAIAPAINELDRSAAQIRRALARDPDSRLLLEQLRRTYARRLELSQRVLVG